VNGTQYVAALLRFTATIIRAVLSPNYFCCIDHLMRLNLYMIIFISPNKHW